MYYFVVLPGIRFLYKYCFQPLPDFSADKPRELVHYPRHQAHWSTYLSSFKLLFTISAYISGNKSRNNSSRLRHHVLPNSRGVLGMRLPLLPTLCGPMRQLPKPRHHTENNTGRIRLHDSLGSSRISTGLGSLQRTTKLLRLGVRKWPLTQELSTSLSMKSLVFGNGLLFLAFAATGKIRSGSLEGIPLRVQAEGFVHPPTTVPAFLPLHWS